MTPSIARIGHQDDQRGRRDTERIRREDLLLCGHRVSPVRPLPMTELVTSLFAVSGSGRSTQRTDASS